MSPPASSPWDDAHPMGEPPRKPPQARGKPPRCQHRAALPALRAGTRPVPRGWARPRSLPSPRLGSGVGIYTVPASPRCQGSGDAGTQREEGRGPSSSSARGSFLAHGAAGQGRTRGGRKEFLPRRVAKPRQRGALHPWGHPRLNPGSALSIPTQRLRLGPGQRLPRPHLLEDEDGEGGMGTAREQQRPRRRTGPSRPEAPSLRHQHAALKGRRRRRRGGTWQIPAGVS